MTDPRRSAGDHQLGHLGYKEALLPFGDPDASDPDPDVRKRFFGKYRGSVVNNIDLLGQGRLLVRVPDVLGILPSSWALPCIPLAGAAFGTMFTPPPIGSSVWVEFEQGDPQKPIWVGCFWDTSDVPGERGLESTLTGAGPALALETLTSGIGVSDVPLGLPPGQVSLYTEKGAVAIVLNPSGITLWAPSGNVSVVASTFTVNGAALTVA